MKYMTSGDIHRMFKQEDKGTIIRRNNVRRIALENGILCTRTYKITDKGRRRKYRISRLGFPARRHGDFRCTDKEDGL